MRKLPIVLAGIAGLHVSPVLAQASLPDPAAVSAALDAFPAVVAAEARRGAAAAEASSLAAGPDEITLSGSYARRSIDLEGRFDEYDLTVSRAFRLPGKARLDREIGRFGMEAARNRAEDARHQAALVLADSWWDWLAAAAEARIDRQAVENYAATLAAVRRRVALRDAAVLDADMAEAALGAARTAAGQSQRREAIARARLVARFPGLELPDQDPELGVPELPEGEPGRFQAQIIERSHEIAGAVAEAQRANAVVERTSRDRLADPSLGVRLFSERNGAERGAGLVVSMPLGGKHRRAFTDKAVAETVAAQAEAQAARLAVQEMATTDLADVRLSVDAWSSARDALNAQMAALMKLRRGQAAGEIDLSDVLMGERQVHEAFRSEAVARAEAHRAITRLRIDSHELWITE